MNSPTPKPPTAAVLIIGDEVLSGKVADTNSPFLIRALRTRGISLREIRVISDQIDEIERAVLALCQMATHVFSTGGIGPTHDDKTIEAVARAFGRAVVRHPELERRVAMRHGRPLNRARQRLAEIPEGAVVHFQPENPISVIQLDNLFVLPGVPSLMRLCFSHIADRLAGHPFHSAALGLQVPESDAAEILAAVQEGHPEVAIGSYPRFDGGPVRVKITVDSQEQRLVEQALTELRERLPPDWLVPLPGDGRTDSQPDRS